MTIETASYRTEAVYDPLCMCAHAIAFLLPTVCECVCVCVCVCVCACVRVCICVCVLQGEPGFQGTTGPRGHPGDGHPGEKVLETQTERLTDCTKHTHTYIKSQKSK